jgi:hypothetical protein
MHMDARTRHRWSCALRVPWRSSSKKRSVTLSNRRPSLAACYPDAYPSCATVAGTAIAFAARDGRSFKRLAKSPLNALVPVAFWPEPEPTSMVFRNCGSPTAR